MEGIFDKNNPLISKLHYAGQGIVMPTLGKTVTSGTLAKIPSAYVGKIFGRASGEATITRGPKLFGGYFTSAESAKGGSAAEPTSTGTLDIWPGGAPGVGGVESAKGVINAIAARSSRRGTVMPGLGVAAAIAKKKPKKLVYSQLTAPLRRLEGSAGRPYPGVVLPTTPNPSGEQVFKGQWRGGKKAPMPYV